MGTLLIVVAVALGAQAGAAGEDIAEYQDLQTLPPETAQWLWALTQCEPQHTLSVITVRFPDVACPHGGKLVTVGTDLDADRRLAPGEVEHVIELCDDQRDDKLDALRTANLCLHMEVAGALRFSHQLERALAPEKRLVPRKLLESLVSPNDS